MHQAWQTDVRTALLGRIKASPHFADVPGWKHRVLRGTLHSAALYADIVAFKNILKKHENRVQIRALPAGRQSPGTLDTPERASDVDIRYYLDQRFA